MNYTYDAADRMATVTDWLTKQTSYAYDNAGRLTGTTYPNGVTAAVTYDNADRLLSVTNAKTGTFSSFTYTLDGVGNRTQMVATGAAAGTHTYAYDSLYRLTSVTYPGPTTHTYTYDAIGNRTAKNATTYTYNNADEMTAAGGVTYTYDANGNQTGRGTDTFTFDHENRMTQSVVGGVTSSSVYYGNGVRKSHTVNGATTSYQYDVLASLPVVIQDGTYSYVHGLDLISMTDGSGNQHYFSYDGLGSVSDLTDGTGAVTDTFAYEVFGAVTTRTGTTPNVWKFTGEQADDGAGDSGYYFLRARHYDPATGRFVGRDKVKFSQRYAYAGNNPVLLVDPSGLCRRSMSPKDWADCALDAGTTALSCLTPLTRCQEGIKVAGMGVATVTFGVGIIAVGCFASEVTGPGAPILCADAVVGGLAAIVAGSAMIRSAFEPWHERASTLPERTGNATTLSMTAHSSWGASLRGRGSETPAKE